MRPRDRFILVFLLLSGTLAGYGQNLESVLSAMDRSAVGFRSAQCDLASDQYTKVVDEHDAQSGVMYVRRQGSDTQMVADITQPDRKIVFFTGGTLRLYQPAAKTITEYDVGQNKAAVESFLVLGFGGRGHDLPKSFDVKYDGTEHVQGVNAARLVLTPKSTKMRNMFQTITLWIDPARGVSVQQKFLNAEGDYRLTKYSNIQINTKIPDDVFKLKTSGKVTVVRPKG